ncbi:MAG: hypothetical protein OEW50_02940 [Gammaproteobacteria bacterium]|nr:hypothetical protein [Gammaproteobacteria bacterium]
MRLPENLRRLAERLAGREPSVEDERLLELFRNRVELKKELTALDDDRHRLLDRLKLQEGATMRVEEQLAALEQYLGRPEEGYKSLAYYQLKALWRVACKRLEQFGAELARQQKDRERRQQVAEFERHKRERIAVFERELTEARVLGEQLQAEQKLARQRLAQLNGFWNYFRRRRAVEEIHARDYRLVEATAQISKLEAEVAAIEAEPPPLFAGLSVDGRRAINVAVIAYAEMLYDRLAAGGLAELARQSTLKRVFDAHYGAPQACHELMQRAAKAAGEIEGMSEDLAEIKARADRLRRQAAYRKEEETVPAPESIAAIDSGATGKRTPNVLLDEYWEIYRALVR